MSNENKTDLLIVGCGVAGLSAAVTALEKGLSVTVLERSGEADFGGNSRWTEAYMRMKNDSEISDDFEDHFAENIGWNIEPTVLGALSDAYHDWPPTVRAHSLPDPEVISTFADQVPPTIQWLKGLGLRFEPQPIYLLTQNTTRIAAQGGGLGIITRLMEEAVKLGARVLYRTTAVGLVLDDAGQVSGIRTKGPDGRVEILSAKNVVLASGGYQGNPEMMTHYIGEKARHIRPVAPGGHYNKGEGIRMALEIGAAPAGEFGSYHAEPIDPRSRQPEAVVFIYPYGILVNKNAKRFVDEAPGTTDAHYDNITRSIADQPDGISYVIFDAQVEDIPRWTTSIRSEVKPFEAETIADLAAMIDLNPETLNETVECFNAACPAGDDPFSPLQLDGRGVDLDPVKSNWCRPIVKAPFRALPVISSNCFTFGGLKVDPHARVIDQDGKIIPGLYAAGETMGIYHRVYTGSTSVLRGLVFGRQAALHAASATN